MDWDNAVLMAGSIDQSTAATVAAYDAIAAAYDARRGCLPDAMRAWIGRFAGVVGSGGLVADLGCGPARHGQVLAGLGLRVVGLDLSAGMLSVARARLPHLVQADLRRLPLHSEALDGVWSAAALLHVPRSDAPAVVGEYRRVLRAGGTLGLVTAAGEGEGWEPVAYAPGWRRWFVYYTPDQLLPLLEGAGLDPVELHEQEYGRQWLHVLARALPREPRLPLR
jgi:SAM-dependent methyltransferase